MKNTNLLRCDKRKSVFFISFNCHILKSFSIFAKQKKNQTNGAAGEKKFRVQCKNLAFYSTESHIESFFAEQKRKNGAAQPGWCGQQPSSPWYSRGSTMVFFFFFFFFFLKIFRLLLRRNRTLYGSGAPDLRRVSLRSIPYSLFYFVFYLRFFVSSVPLWFFLTPFPLCVLLLFYYTKQGMRATVHITFLFFPSNPYPTHYCCEGVCSTSPHQRKGRKRKEKK